MSGSKPDANTSGLVYSGIAAFRPHVELLESLAIKAITDAGDSSLRAEMNLALDGQPGKQFREVVHLRDRREAGAFFTGAGLRERALQPILSNISSESVIIDPACGIGDLLIASCRNLPVEQDVATTIETWGNQIVGFDIHPEFIRATKARLVLSAANRLDVYTPPGMISLDSVFPNVKVCNGLTDGSTISTGTHIVLNPPYGMMPTPDGCTWSSGQVSMAAVFLDTCLTHAVAGTRIAAILPDVLRSGARYEKWRSRVESFAIVDSVEIVGQFDTWTDVDVFILRLTVQQQPINTLISWWNPIETSSGRRIGDLFDVSVGSVVPHRDPHLGQWQKFIYARLLSGCASYNADTAKCRRYSGRTFKPPFVVVRRTTRPDRSHRAVATVVTGERPVAVENHLIVIKPHDESLARCNQLITVLESSHTREWLDKRIRCRHFTVSSLRELPWLE